MKSVYILFCLFLITSCQFLDKRVPSEQELLEQRLKEINWKTVDKFPSLESCDSIKSEVEQRTCFFEYLTQTIQEKLNADTLSILYPNLDTLQVKVTVFPNATILFEPKLNPKIDSKEALKVDSLIQNRLVGFPKINPAIKHGIPVKTEFILPVIIRSDAN